MFYSSEVPGWIRTELSNFLFCKGAEGREGGIGPPGPRGIGEPGLPVSQYICIGSWNTTK